MSVSGGMQRTTNQLYRDCLRLIRHVAPGGSRSVKHVALRQTVRIEFDKRKDETDSNLIEQYKAQAIRALSNYMLQAAAPKDPKVANAMKEYHGRSVQAAQQHQNEQQQQSQRQQ